MSGWVTTFYSYKGGVGRTFLLANVAWLLARWGRRVLCLDWDLEAPGLHRYLAAHAPKNRGVVDLVEHLGSGRDAPWLDWVERLAGPWTDNGCLHLLAAGHGDDDYVRRVQQLQWDALSNAGLEEGLERTREEWVASYDHVLLDSRTGITDIGGICAAQLPDLLVLTFTATFQSLEGAIDVASRAARARASMPISRGEFHVLPVPCRIHAGEEDSLEKEWSERFEHRLSHLFAPWKTRSVATREYVTHLRVREQARWSFGEQLPVRTEPIDDPLRVSHAFANVAALIDSRLDEADRVVQDRHSLMSQLAGSAGLNAPKQAERFTAYDVFISYPWQMLEFVQQLAATLTDAGLRVYYWDQTIPAGDPHINEALYRAREQSRAFVLVVSDDFNARLQWDEFKHIERRIDESDIPVIPLFSSSKAFDGAPSSLTHRFGLFLDEDGSRAHIAQQLTKSLLRQLGKA